MAKRKKFDAKRAATHEVTTALLRTAEWLLASLRRAARKPRKTTRELLQENQLATDAVPQLAQIQLIIAEIHQLIQQHNWTYTGAISGGLALPAILATATSTISHLSAYSTAILVYVFDEEAMFDDARLHNYGLRLGYALCLLTTGGVYFGSQMAVNHLAPTGLFSENYEQLLEEAISGVHFEKQKTKVLGNQLKQAAERMNWQTTYGLPLLNFVLFSFAAGFFKLTGEGDKEYDVKNAPLLATYLMLASICGFFSPFVGRAFRQMISLWANRNFTNNASEMVEQFNQSLCPQTDATGIKWRLHGNCVEKSVLSCRYAPSTKILKEGVEVELYDYFLALVEYCLTHKLDSIKIVEDEICLSFEHALLLMQHSELDPYVNQQLQRLIEREKTKQVTLNKLRLAGQQKISLLDPSIRPSGRIFSDIVSAMSEAEAQPQQRGQHPIIRFSNPLWLFDPNNSAPQALMPIRFNSLPRSVHFLSAIAPEFFIKSALASTHKDSIIANLRKGNVISRGVTHDKGNSVGIKERNRVYVDMNQQLQVSDLVLKFPNVRVYLRLIEKHGRHQLYLVDGVSGHGH